MSRFRAFCYLVALTLVLFAGWFAYSSDWRRAAAVALAAGALLLVGHLVVETERRGRLVGGGR